MPSSRAIVAAWSRDRPSFPNYEAGSWGPLTVEKILRQQEQAGKLKPGDVIIEPTSGNTGIGLAMVAQAKGYKCVFVCPDKVSEDKRNVLKAYGAEVVVCPTAVAPDHPDSYYSVSDRLLKTAHYRNFTKLGGRVRPARLVLNDALTPSTGRVAWFSGRVLGISGEPVFTSTSRRVRSAVPICT